MQVDKRLYGRGWNSCNLIKSYDSHIESEGYIAISPMDKILLLVLSLSTGLKRRDRAM